MRLSDIMSHMHLAGYAEVALLIFLIVFAAIAYQTFRHSSRSRWQADKQIPLSDAAISGTHSAGNE